MTALLPVLLLVLQLAPTEAGSKIWLGRVGEIEQYITTAEIVRTAKIGIGVTNPERAFFAPGGPIDSVAWKPITPGIYRGYWESYKSEVAAYELDKLLDLQMVPPAVERRYRGRLGAAIMWVPRLRSWKDAAAGRPNDSNVDLQFIRMKMFDNFIGNKDRNAGNLQIDPLWNVILIDHSRAFAASRDLPFEMTRIDRPLWDRMRALDETRLDAALGRWLSRKEIRAVVERVNRMQVAIDRLVGRTGEAGVFVGPRKPKT
jgi:hypothetical protein